MTDENKRTRTLAETIQILIDAKLMEIHTSMPAKIVSYNAATNMAVVQPLLKRKYIDEDFPVELPTISNVPIAFPRMGTAWIKFPVNPGDEGKISICERSIDKWLTTGGSVDPDDPRKFSLSDAIFEPGLNSLTNPMFPLGAADSLQIQHGTSNFEITKSGKFKMSGLTDELVALIKEFAELLKATTVDTLGGPAPVTVATQTLIDVFIVKLEAFGDL